jgi:hypothetical protein
MGMKDSDDYITARAANPRTGLISPSLAGTPRTPESPAEALKLRAQRVRPANLELLRHGQAMRVLALQTSFAATLSREGPLSTMTDL